MIESISKDGNEMKSSRLILSAVVFVIAAGSFSVAVTSAQESSAPPKIEGTPQTQVAMPDTLPTPVIDEGGKNVRIFLDKVEVLGSIAKPQALFIIPGNDPKVDGIQIDRSFFREIFRSMEKSRFPHSTRRNPRGHIPW